MKKIILNLIFMSYPGMNMGKVIVGIILTRVYNRLTNLCMQIY